MASISSVRSSFMCQEPFQAQQVTRTDNRVHIGSAINSAEPYPTAYLVGAVEMRVICRLLIHDFFSFLSVVGTGQFFRGKRTSILSNVFNVGRTIISRNVSLKIASGATCVERPKNSGWSGKTTFTIRSSTISCGWGSSIGKGRMFVLMRRSQPCVSQLLWQQDCCLVSWNWKRR